MIPHDHGNRDKNNNQHGCGSICRKFSTLVRADAVKTYIDGVIATADALVYKGVIDCSTTEDTTNELILVGVTSDATTTINMQYEFVTLKKMATDEWILLGSLG